MFRKSTKLLALAGIVAVLGVSLPVHAMKPSRTAVEAVGDGLPDAGLDPRYNEPKDIPAAIANAPFLVELGKSGMWLGFALVIIQTIIFVLKQLKDKFGAVMKKWGTLIVLVLSGAAALLASVVGGLSWPMSVMVFLGTVAPKLIVDIMNEFMAPAPAPVPAPVVPAPAPVPAPVDPAKKP